MLGFWEGPWPRRGYLHRMTDGSRGTGLGSQGLLPSSTMGCLCSRHQNTCQAGIWDRNVQIEPNRHLGFSVPFPSGWDLWLSLPDRSDRGL